MHAPNTGHCFDTAHATAYAVTTFSKQETFSIKMKKMNKRSLGVVEVQLVEIGLSTSDWQNIF